jgi:hypothetical protein
VLIYFLLEHKKLRRPSHRPAASGICSENSRLASTQQSATLCRDTNRHLPRRQTVGRTHITPAQNPRQPTAQRMLSGQRCLEGERPMSIGRSRPVTRTRSRWHTPMRSRTGMRRPTGSAFAELLPGD